MYYHRHNVYNAQQYLIMSSCKGAMSRDLSSKGYFINIYLKMYDEIINVKNLSRLSL